MKFLKFGLFGMLFFAIATVSSGQVLEPETPPQDRPWKKEHTKDMIAIPYDYIRESDVMWGKTIWRIIDLRQKINHPLYYPEIPVRGRVNLAQLIWDAVTEEQTLTAYAEEDFLEIVPAEDVIANNSAIDSMWVPKLTDPDMDSLIVTKEDFASKDVKKILIREDWFFDKQRSVMDVRIMGMALVKDEYTVDPQTGDEVYKGAKILFWIYFPEARPLFAQQEVYNRFNDAERRSFDDIFLKRLFGSYITKEENVYDRQINEYTRGIHALLEAEKIKSEIQVIEMDLWEY